jgi:glucosamine-6-phosphate deaminase
MRKLSSIAPDWWDYTTLDNEIVQAAARLTPEKMLKLSRPGFKVVFHDTLEEFYLAEALEYISVAPSGQRSNCRSSPASSTN